MTAYGLVGFSGFSSMATALPVVVERDDAVALGIGDVVGENDAAVGVGPALQLLAEAGAVEDVVAEDQGDRIGADEVGAEGERLRQAARLGLHRVAERAAELGAVAEQAAEGASGHRAW